MAVNNKTYQPVQAITTLSGEDLPAFRFVSHTGSLCSADTKSLGVTETEWVNGDYASIITLGTIAVETSGTINTGDDVTADADGKAKAVAASEPVNGRALDSCSGAGFIRILLVP